ncbi:hypothetical protein [Sphingobacterium sp.]|uniref:hypothetical protein n=1 Tax=Sphingobacterium sp. TaxID=341027 RepID=UPI0028ADB411|nr:hypothetical protein [Sphingobacterium sp.]
MKSIITFLLVFICFSAFSQTEFKMNEGYLVWQKVFDVNCSPNELFTFIQSKGYFKEISKTDTTFTAIFEGVEPDYKGFGSSEMSTPIYISRSFINGGVNIECRNGRYRVTLTNLTLEQKYNDTLSRQGEKSKIESYSGRKEIKGSFLKKPALILNYTFNKIFTFKESSDRW